MSKIAAEQNVETVSGWLVSEELVESLQAIAGITGLGEEGRLFLEGVGFESILELLDTINAIAVPLPAAPLGK